MTDKPVLTPGPDHPITVTPSQQHVTVTVAENAVWSYHAVPAVSDIAGRVAFYAHQVEISAG
jgi:uncharacterized protein (DUF427 family)